MRLLYSLVVFALALTAAHAQPSVSVSLLTKTVLMQGDYALFNVSVSAGRPCEAGGKRERKQ